MLADIEELNAIVDAMRVSGNMSTDDTSLEVADTKEAAFGEVMDFQVVRSSSNYITHYVSHHRDFSSLVIVVLWKSEFSGPAISSSGKKGVKWKKRRQTSKTWTCLFLAFHVMKTFSEGLILQECSLMCKPSLLS